jgi:hypothetical protein
VFPVEQCRKDVKSRLLDTGHTSAETETDLLKSVDHGAPNAKQKTVSVIDTHLLPSKKGTVSVSKKRGVTNTELKLYLKGASAAQQAQIQMIYRVFDVMDADSDGVLSASDVRAYFRSVNRISDDITVRKWIRARDINQSGTVSLPEFVASFAHQLDPSSRSTSIFKNANGGETVSSSIAIAFGYLRLGNSPPEVLKAVEMADEYIRRALDSPSTSTFWRISKKDAVFHQVIGRLFGGVKFMYAVGFVDEQNGSVLALRDETGTEWSTIPDSVRRKLMRNMEELNLQKQSLAELSVSHIAAGG